MSHTPFITFSAELASLSSRENVQREDILIRLLKKTTLAFVAIQGAYKGVEEHSIRVLVPDSESIVAVMRLAEVFQQESVLYVDEHRRASLIFVESRYREPVGTWTRVTKTDALSRDGYSKIGDRYYAVA